MANVEQNDENLSANIDEKTDLIECPVCGSVIDKIGLHCIHQQK